MSIDVSNLDMRQLYTSIESELEKVNFNLLWPGFSKMEFAIYNRETVYLKDEEIPYDTRFVGNTSINYNGRNLAIIDVDNIGEDNIKTLTYLMVHEMFHSYQFSNGDTRFPNDLKALYYPRDLKNYGIKYLENKLIVEALNTADKNSKMDILKQIIGLRISRISKYGDAINYELALETMEASAEYCGMKAYKTIDKEEYYKRMEHYKDLLSNDIKMLFDIRRISYYVGTLFLFLLEELNITFTQEIKSDSKYIFEEIAEKIDYNKINIDEIQEINLEEYFMDYTNNIKLKFKDFFEKNIKIYTGNFKICGYDPMNMIKEGDNVFCSHFIKLTDLVENKELFLQGPVVIELKNDSYTEVKKYYIINN